MSKFFINILIKLIKLLDAKETRILDNFIHQNYSKNEPLYPQNLHFSYWDRQVLAWDKLPPPIRPSMEDMSIYSDFLKQKREKKRILILGSTPELRDLAAETGAKVYVADFSYNMTSAMLKFTKRVDLLKEVWIKESWLDIPFPNGFFDVILGDVVFHQITPNLEDDFLKKIKSLLDERGIFLSRFFYLDENFCSKRLIDVTDHVLKGSFLVEEKAALLRLQTTWLFTDFRKREFNRGRSYSEFYDLVNEFEALGNDRLLGGVLDSLKSNKQSYRNWSPPKREELFKMLNRFFKIKNTNCAKDYLWSQYFPIFSLEPKN